MLGVCRMQKEYEWYTPAWLGRRNQWQELTPGVMPAVPEDYNALDPSKLNMESSYACPVRVAFREMR